MVSMVDKTGELRSDKELQAATDCIKTIMVKHPLTLPFLTVHAGIIMNCLEELQQRRTRDRVTQLWKGTTAEKGKLPRKKPAEGGMNYIYPTP